MTESLSTPDLIVAKSRALGGRGNLSVGYHHSPHHNGRDWKAVTTAKNKDKYFNLSAWGMSPQDAIHNLWESLRNTKAPRRPTAPTT